MFIQCLKIELRRGFKSISFKIALFIGLIITISHFIQHVIPEAMVIMDKTFYKNDFCFPWSVFNGWIGGEYFSLQPSLYYMIITLLAVIPYGATYYLDKKRGYIKNLYTRADKMSCLLSNYITMFLTAGVVTTIPLLVNLMLTMTVLPAIKPSACSRQFPISEYSMWSDLFYDHPFIYLFLFLLIDFIYVGLFACISLVVSFLVENRFVVMLFPFILFFFLNAVTKFVDPALSPYYILMPFQTIPLVFPYILIEIFVLFMSTFGIFIWRGKKNDTF